MWPIIISLGIGIGSLFLGRLFAPTPPPQVGPRVGDLNSGSTQPGNPIPVHWGTMKQTGQLIWASALLESAHITYIPGSSGGFGKGGDTSTTSTEYTYAVHCAVGVCEGPVYQFRRIWANDKIIWTNPLIGLTTALEDAYYAEMRRLWEDQGLTDPTSVYLASFWFAFNNYRADDISLSSLIDANAFILSHPGDGATPPIAIPDPNQAAVEAVLTQMYFDFVKNATYSAHENRFDYIELYHGGNLQRPCPLIEQYLGVGNTPAFRNTAYIVLANLQLKDFGNTIPQFRVEVQKTADPATLDQIIADICERSDLTEDQYDVSNLPETVVQGYTIPEPTSGRESLYRLQKIFPFDAVESAYRLIFQWINTAAFIRVRREDFGAKGDQEDLPASEHVVRIDESELPKQLLLRFQEPERNYSLNTVRATREQTESNAVEQLDIQVALSRDEAKSLITEQMMLRLMARRITKIRFPRKYAIVEPTDPIVVPSKADAEVTYDLRCLEQRIGADGIVELTFMDHATHAVIAPTLDVDVVTTEDDSATQKQSSATNAYLIDGPLLTNAEPDNIGFYVVLDGSRTGWGGGQLMLNTLSGQTVTVFGGAVPVEAGGSSFLTVATGTVLGADGSAMNALGTGHAMIWDRVNTLTVLLTNPNAELISSDEETILAQPTNICVVGDEYIAFVNATELGNGLWKLDTLLRGLRGTESHIDTHVSGERFVAISTTNVQRVAHEEQHLNVEGTYRAITVNAPLDSAPDITFTNTGNSLRPRAPIIFYQDRDTDDDIALEWIPRLRQMPVSWGKELPAELDQPYEMYEIDVYQDDVLMETYEFTDLRTWTYTNAMQVTDGVDPSSPVQLDLYQLGEIVGRGYVSRINI